MTTNGFITVTERSGDLRAGDITSTASDVTLTSPARILDAERGDGLLGSDPTPTDVTGVNITLTAGTGLVTGGIGLPSNFLEINVGTGVLNAFDRLAATTSGIFLTETVGDLRSTRCGRAATSTLTTVAGSIVDARNDARGQHLRDEHRPRRQRRRREHRRRARNDLEIESSHAAAGDVGLEATASIYVTETRGTLHLVLAEALGGDIRITVRETATATPAPAAAAFTGQVTFNGTTLTGSFAASGFLAEHDAADHGRDAVRRRLHDRLGDRHDDHAVGDARGHERRAHRRDADRPGHARRGPRPAARRRRALRRERAAHGPARPDRGERLRPAAVGDDVTTTTNSEIVAGRDIDIYGDWTNGDPHFGTTMVLRGTITPGAGFVTRVWGQTDVDSIQFGDPERRGGRHHARLARLHPARRRDARLRRRRRGPSHRLLPADDERRRRAHAHARRPGRDRPLRDLHHRQPGLAAQLRHQPARHRRARTTASTRPRSTAATRLYGAPAPAGTQVRGRRHLPAARRRSRSPGETTDRPAYVALLAGRGGAPVEQRARAAPPATTSTATATRSPATSRAPSSSGSTTTPRSTAA